jgi:hypothetical protein
MVFTLTAAQKCALEHVQELAGKRQEQALARIKAALSDCRPDADGRGLFQAVTRIARLNVNFHPDRLIADGRSVIVALYEEGIYRSQFETGISNGGLTAFPGGDRDRWEAAMFGGAYQVEGVQDTERPKYGGLNLMNYSDGACPRFGSCHLRLRPAVLPRATLTFGDSATDPVDIGRINAFEPVLAGLLERIAEDGNALGTRGASVATFVDALLASNSEAGQSFFGAKQGRALDDYIEAQIHGEHSIARDAEAIVADPSFQGTETGEVIEATARKYRLTLEWHPGFELALSEVPDDFRGPEMPALAKRVLDGWAVGDAHIDAAAIGLAAASVGTHPELWQDWGTPKRTLQHLKYLWHILVIYGKPRMS